MAITKMRKLRVIAVRADCERLFHELILLGLVEPANPSALPPDERTSAELVLSPKSSSGEAAMAQAHVFVRALDVIAPYLTEKSGIFTPRAQLAPEIILDGGDYDAALELAERLDEISARLRHISMEETREGARLAALLPWERMTLPLGETGTARVGVMFGSISASVNIIDAERAVADNVPLAQIFEISQAGGVRNISLIYWRDDESALLSALSGFAFAQTAPRDERSTAREAISRVRARLEALQSDRENLISEIIESTAHADRLRRAYDRALTIAARDDCAALVLESDATVSMTGWFPARDEDRVMKMLAKFECAHEVSDPAPEEYPFVPVRLDNNALTRPLNMVTEMYSLPAYDGVDPNPLMAPFFILFFSLMMADMGYGLLMVLAALIYRFKAKPRGGIGSFAGMLLLCGIGTIIAGALTVSFFGNAPALIAPLVGLSYTPPYTPLFDPMRDTYALLYGALALGGVQIITGMAINMIKKIKDGHALDGICSAVPWWILFAGIGLGALGITWIVTIAGVAALIATQGRASPSIPGKIIGGIASLYNITGFFGDVLSYARIMALMLAGGAIANAFNEIAAKPGSVIAFIPIAVIGHALNLGLNLIGCYVHDLRLQCLEYFGKFYKDGGRAFSPLRVISRHYDIINK